MTTQATQSVGSRGLARSLVVLMLGAVMLAACDESDGDGDRGGIDSFGDDVSNAFNQDPNDEPLDASDLDVTMTSRIEPLNL